MVSILIIFLCISIQIIFGFTFITDEDTIKQNGKQIYNFALSGKRDDFTLRDFNFSAMQFDWIFLVINEGLNGLNETFRKANFLTPLPLLLYLHKS